MVTDSSANGPQATVRLGLILCHIARLGLAMQIEEKWSALAEETPATDDLAPVVDAARVVEHPSRSWGQQRVQIGQGARGPEEGALGPQFIPANPDNLPGGIDPGRLAADITRQDAERRQSPGNPEAGLPTGGRCRIPPDNPSQAIDGKGATRAANRDSQRRRTSITPDGCLLDAIRRCSHTDNRPRIVEGKGATRRPAQGAEVGQLTTAPDDGVALIPLGARIPDDQSGSIERDGLTFAA